MLLRSTIQLLRFHFSLFLLPVFLFAVSQVPRPDWGSAAIVFVILHLLVYPSSNGYNSYMDRDTTPIGGLYAPMQPTRQLFYITFIMDILAVLFALSISILFSAGVLLYIMASRAYSYRGIRLKKFPVAGYLTVFIFQGAVIFYISYHAVSSGNNLSVPLLPCLASSLLIGALYPLTQVYQHEADRSDGVVTLSALLGRKGTFIFTMVLFMAASLVLFLFFNNTGNPGYFLFFMMAMFPVLCYFFYWMFHVWRDAARADFAGSMKMNLIATGCTLIFFITLIIRNH